MYNENWGSQNPIEQSQTLSGSGLVCSQTGFYIIKLQTFITWGLFLSKELKHFSFNSSYKLTASQLRFTSWYYMQFIDDTPRLYAVNKKNEYISLEGTLASQRFKQLSSHPNSCIDKELSRMYPQFWAIYGSENTAKHRELNGHVVYGRKKTRRSRGGKRHKS